METQQIHWIYTDHLDILQRKFRPFVRNLRKKDQVMVRGE